MTMTDEERAAYNALSAKLQHQARNNGHDHPHKFEAGPDPVPAGCLPRCRVCKTTIKASIALAVADVQRLALKGRM